MKGRTFEITILGFVLFILFLAVYNSTVHKQVPVRAIVSVRCRTIHKPKSGCPPQWAEQRGTFKEADGSIISSCVATPELNLDDCTDYLMPGEEMTVPFFIPREPPRNPPPGPLSESFIREERKIP